MPTITKKELEDYKKMCYDREHSRLLTVDGLRLICDGFNRDPEALGNTFLKHWPESSLRITDKLAKFTSSVIEQETEVILWR